MSRHFQPVIQQITRKSHTQLLMKKSRKIGRRKPHIFCCLLQREGSSVVLLNISDSLADKFVLAAAFFFLRILGFPVEKTAEDADTA